LGQKTVVVVVVAAAAAKEIHKHSIWVKHLVIALIQQQHTQVVALW
jgi:hypothetical protein